MTYYLHNPSLWRQFGFTLIEVLIAAVVLAVGLLGLAGLQGLTLRMSQGAYLRSQAVNLAYEIADIMRANQDNAANYVVDALDYIGSFPACNASYVRADTGDIVADDVDEWVNHIVCFLPQGEASIAQAGNLITITVCWDETHVEAAGNDPVCQAVNLEGTMHFSFVTEL
ncbi:MAG: type IV pilus modification protein PilV [Halochromatium sp.]|nr:type IV pilus modification protein PilV [Halochromatium sp.]